MIYKIGVLRGKCQEIIGLHSFCEPLRNFCELWNIDLRMQDGFLYGYKRVGDWEQHYIEAASMEEAINDCRNSLNLLNIIR